MTSTGIFWQRGPAFAKSELRPALYSHTVESLLIPVADGQSDVRNLAVAGLLTTESTANSGHSASHSLCWLERPAGGRSTGIQGQGCRSDGRFPAGFTRNTSTMRPIRVFCFDLLIRRRRDSFFVDTHLFCPLLLHLQAYLRLQVQDKIPDSSNQG